MVDVGNMQGKRPPVCQRRQRMEQADAVRAATHADYDCRRHRRKELVLRLCGSQGIQQWVGSTLCGHASIIPCAATVSGAPQA